MAHRCRSHEKLRAIRDGLEETEPDPWDWRPCPEWHEQLSLADLIHDFSVPGLVAWVLGLETEDLPGYGTGIDIDEDFETLSLTDAAVALVLA